MQKQPGGALGFFSHISFVAFLFWLRRGLRLRRYEMYPSVEERAADIRRMGEEDVRSFEKNKRAFLATEALLGNLPKVKSPTDFTMGDDPKSVHLLQRNTMRAVRDMRDRLDHELNDSSEGLSGMLSCIENHEARMGCHLRLPKRHAGKGLLDQIDALNTGVERKKWVAAFHDGDILEDVHFTYQNAMNLKYVLADLGVNAVVVNETFNRSINGEDKDLKEETEKRIVHVSRTQSLFPSAIILLIFLGVALIGIPISEGGFSSNSITCLVVGVIISAVLCGILFLLNKPINILKEKLAFRIIAKDTPEYETVMTLVLGDLVGADHDKAYSDMVSLLLECYNIYTRTDEKFTAYTKAFLPDRAVFLAGTILEQLDAGADFSQALFRADQVVEREKEKMRRIAWEKQESEKAEKHRLKVLDETRRHNKEMEYQRARAAAAAEAAERDVAELRDYEAERVKELKKLREKSN